MSGYIHPERESFVFRVFVIDADNNIRMVVVDPGNGNVLLSQQIAPNPTNRIIENKTRFITSAIDGNDNQLTNNGTTTSRSITFHFEQQAGADFFRCEIDNQIKSCTSPLTLSNLTIGGHLFRIYIYHTSGLMEKS